MYLSLAPLLFAIEDELHYQVCNLCVGARSLKIRFVSIQITIHNMYINVLTDLCNQFDWKVKKEINNIKKSWNYEYLNKGEIF